MHTTYHCEVCQNGGLSISSRDSCIKEGVGIAWHGSCVGLQKSSLHEITSVHAIYSPWHCYGCIICDEAGLATAP